MMASMGEKMSQLRKNTHNAIGIMTVFVIALLMAATMLVSCDSTNPKEESTMESNQKALLERFDITEESAERIAKGMDIVGVGTVKSIEVDKQLSSFFTVYVTDDKDEKYYLILTSSGSLTTIYKDGPDGEYLLGTEQ
jgi:uncharacterized protein YpmB